MICPNCNKEHNILEYNDFYEGFCSRECLDEYLIKIDLWFETIRQRIKPNGEIQMERETR